MIRRPATTARETAGSKSLCSAPTRAARRRPHKRNRPPPSSSAYQRGSAYWASLHAREELAPRAADGHGIAVPCEELAPFDAKSRLKPARFLCKLQDLCDNAFPHRRSVLWF